MMNTTNDITPMQRFWRLLKPDGKEIRDLYIYSTYSGLVGLSLPLGIQAIVNFIQVGQVSASWVVLVVLVVLGVGITGLLQILQLRIAERLQQKIFSRAAFEFTFRVTRIKMEKLYNYYAPELMNRFFDVMSVQKGLAKILLDFSIATLQVLFGLILLSFYHPFFIIFSFLLLIIIYVIIRLTAKRGLDTSLTESKYKYQLVHWLEEVARAATTFKLAGKSSLPLSKTDSHVGRYLDAREAHFKVLVQQYTLMVVFKVLVAAGLLALGGALVMNQTINIGQFIAAEIIILLVMASVEKLIMSFETIYDVLTALAKLGQVTDLELDQHEGLNLAKECDEKGLSIRLKDVNFCYPDGEAILKKLSLSIAASEKVMITGKNGSGKSTLLQIVAGLYQIQSGQVIYNGLPLGNYNLSSVRSVIGDMLSQEDIFEGTVLQNITMGRKGIGLKEAQWAIEKMGLNDFIDSLENGLECELGPHGKKLPKSIVQRLLIARSIVGQPKLILIEEALEQIDSKTRKMIIDFLLLKDNKWTLIAVSNDAYLAQKADRIIGLEDGHVMYEGTYETVKNNFSDHA